MDEVSPAVELPSLYRSVLDAIARLERVGERRIAGRIRRDAIAIYSDRWDERGRRRMTRLAAESERILRDHPQAHRLASLLSSAEVA